MLIEELWFPELRYLPNERERLSVWRTVRKEHRTGSLHIQLSAALALLCGFCQVKPEAIVFIRSHNALWVCIWMLLWINVIVNVLFGHLLWHRKTLRATLRRILNERGFSVCMDCGCQLVTASPVCSGCGARPMETVAPAIDRSSGPTKLNRWFWGLLTAVSVFLVPVWHLGLEIYGRVSLRYALQEARANQEPLTFEEILAHRRVWPPEQDGGLVFTQLRPRLMELRKEPKSLAALPVFSKAHSHPLGHRWSPDVLAAAVAGLATVSKEIGGVDRLRDYSGGSLPFAIPKDYAQAEEDGMPELAAMRFAVKLKVLQATARAMQGDTSHVVDDVAVMVRLAELLSDHPTMISSLLKIALDSLVADTLEQVLVVTPIASADLRSIEVYLAETEAADPMYWGVLGERALFFSSVEGILQKGVQPGVNGWIMRDEACCLGLWTRLVRVSKLPSGRPQAAYQLASEAGAYPRRYSLTTTVFPSLERAFTLSMVSTAQVRTARVGLAVERYRLETGGFPERLDQLVPKCLAQVPLDPFDEKPLRYRLTERAAKVYSLGEDEVDDGGGLAEQQDRKPGKDCGFILLRPEFRNLPPVPAT